MSSHARLGHRLRQFSQQGPQKDQRESHFGPAMFMKLPLISLYLRACIFEYPTALDLSFCTFPDIGLYLLAGLFDYFVISLACLFAQMVSTSPSTLRTVQITMLLSSMLSRLYIVGWRPLILCLKIINSKNIRPYGTAFLFIKACPAGFWTFTISLLGFDTSRLGNWMLSIVVMYSYGFWDYIDASGTLLSAVSGGNNANKRTPVKSSWSSSIFSTLKASLIGVTVQAFAKYIPVCILFVVYIVQTFQGELQSHPGFLTLGFEPTIDFLDDVLPLRPLEALVVLVAHNIYALGSKLSDLLSIFLLSKYNASKEPSILAQKATTSSGVSKRIRLLTISPGSSDSHMDCSWDWFELNSSNLRYTALSYVWGSANRCCDITINGRPAKTTESAIEALHMLRSPIKSKVVWIDAICIDQDNKADKERQIPYMADIYQKATHVIIWLGQAEDGYLATGLAKKLWFRATLAKEFGGAIVIEDIEQHAWKALRNMLGSQWFQRVWTIQEVVLAKNRFTGDSISVRYGNGFIDWQTLSWFTRECLKDPKVTDRLSSSDSNIIISNIQATDEFRSIYRAEGPNLSLLYYLARMFRSDLRFGASNDRDRIYALQNLTYQGTSSEDWISPSFHLKIDYDLSVAQIYIDTAKDLLLHRRADQSLDLLAHGGLLPTNRIQKLPSWIPDWSASPISYPFPGLDGSRELISHPNLTSRLLEISNSRRYGDMMNATMLGSTQRQLENRAKEIPNALYCAGTRTIYSFPKFQFALRGDKHLLQIVGFRESKIADVATQFSPIGTALKVQRNGETTLNPIAYIPSDWRPFAEKFTTSEIYARTLVGDLSQSWIDLSQESIPTRPAPATIDAHVKQYEHVSQLVIHGDAEGRQYSFQDPTHGFANLDRNIRAMCAGRVLGATEDGQLGLFPAGTRKGDSVCVFLAGCVPFVLRATEEETLQETSNPALHHLVGPCYVHGIMYGEGIKRIPYLDMKTFWIQ